MSLYKLFIRCRELDSAGQGGLFFHELLLASAKESESVHTTRRWNSIGATLPEKEQEALFSCGLKWRGSSFAERFALPKALVNRIF
jgi:hypothetical protein